METQCIIKVRKQMTFVIDRKRVKVLYIDTSICQNNKSHYTCILRYCNRKQLMPEIYKNNASNFQNNDSFFYHNQSSYLRSLNKF